jgi:MarR family transcriptional regulator, temperature-dependent positive regulator of motility
MHNEAYPDLDEKPAVLLWSVSQLWQRQRKASLKAIDLTLAQYITLACLLWFTKRNEKVTQVMLAERSKLDIMHTSRIVRTLEKKGLLTRFQSPEDSRANYLQITAQGEQVALKGSEMLNVTSNQFFKPIQDREQEFVALMKTLMQANDIPVKMDKTVQITRKLPAPLAEVWEMWTQVENLRQWMSPEGWTTPEASIDLRIGGHIHIVMGGKPIEHIGSSATVSFHGTYTIIEQPHRLVFTWNWEDQQGTQVIVLLRALSATRTEITLIHTGFTNDRSIKEDTYAWTSTLNHLERFLADLKGEG